MRGRRNIFWAEANISCFHNHIFSEIQCIQICNTWQGTIMSVFFSSLLLDCVLPYLSFLFFLVLYFTLSSLLTSSSEFINEVIHLYHVGRAATAKSAPSQTDYKVKLFEKPQNGNWLHKVDYSCLEYPGNCCILLITCLWNENIKTVYLWNAPLQDYEV